MEYAGLIGLGLKLLETFLGSAKSKLPTEVVISLEASISALQAHYDDTITKASFEALRG